MLRNVPTNIFNSTICDTPRPSLKKEGVEVGGRMGERRGGGYVMAVVTRIALQHM